MNVAWIRLGVQWRIELLVVHASLVLLTVAVGLPGGLKAATQAGIWYV